MNAPTLTPEQFDLLQSARVIVREKHLYDLTKHHLAVLDALTMNSLGQCRRSVIIPSNLALHELCGVPAQHIPRALEDLANARIVQVQDLVNGMKRYRVNPDVSTWRVLPKIAEQTSKATRHLIAQLNGGSADDLPDSMAAQIPAFASQETGLGTCMKACATLGFPTDFLPKQEKAA